ncbi:MAG: RNA polymerase sigma factor [Planctomycetota bacterium]
MAHPNADRRDAMDPTAVGRLIEQHRRRVYTLAYYTLGSHADAEDATQLTLVRLWRHADRIDPGKAEGWLVRTTRNVCVDLIRQRGRSRETTGSEANQTAIEAAASHDAPPQAHAEAVETRGEIERALAQMPEPHRSLLILREVQGMTYQAIAEALDMPLTSVRVYLHRARRKLAAQLAPLHETSSTEPTANRPEACTHDA